MGRPKKPTKIKQVQGTNYKCRQQNHEPSFTPLKRVTHVPPSLSRYGKEFFLKNSEVLIAGSVITDADLSILELAAEAWDIMQQAKRSIYWDFQNKKKRTLKQYFSDRDYNRKNMPELMTYESMQSKVIVYLRELGLTPSARSKVDITPPDEKSDMDNLLDD